MSSKFKELREHIDKMKIGDILRRTDYSLHFSVDTNEDSSLDNYRRLFCRAHILEIKDVGVYVKTREIDSYIASSVTKLREECELVPREYDEEWKKSGMIAKDFLYVNRGRIGGKKFGF